MAAVKQFGVLTGCEGSQERRGRGLMGPVKGWCWWVQGVAGETQLRVETDQCVRAGYILFKVRQAAAGGFVEG